MNNVDISSNWERLGEDDPLWTICTDPTKRGNRWDVDEFFLTGQADVRGYLSKLRSCLINPPFKKVLDFGCGVGRLSRAWAERAASVVGVDVSSTMIARGRELNTQIQNLNLIHNPVTDLNVFKDEEFDLVFSHICLQHIPWDIAAGYIREFARICEPGGNVVFQLPSDPPAGTWIRKYRKKIVESLPFGIGKLYRRLRRRSEASFETFFTPADEVLLVAQEVNLRLMKLFPDRSAGAGVKSFIYLFKKGSGNA